MHTNTSTFIIIIVVIIIILPLTLYLSVFLQYSALFFFSQLQKIIGI
jgi:hypothetical protein